MEATGSGPWHVFFGLFVNRQRVISLIDGLNLYHCISNLQRPELQWSNLKALSQTFLKSQSEKLFQVFYFSSYADHVSEETQNRQKAYVRALELSGIVPIFGHFKRKNRKCPFCENKWVGHEEKETDVNIALYLLDLAYQNAFDRALVISNDSDLAPAIKMVRKRFPNKRITTVSPPHHFHSIELINVSSDKTKIRVEHLEKSLFPAVISDPSGIISVSRPLEYMPVTRNNFAKNRSY